MTGSRQDGSKRELVRAQTGRTPREPWRTAATCSFGYPTVIASPSRLDDGTPFPTWAWLTCPYLLQAVSRVESGGGTAEWAARAADSAELAAALQALDADVRAARAAEGAGADACQSVGLAGQQDPLGVKCLHAHVAYALAGLADPIGAAVLAEVGPECADERCADLARRIAEAVAEEGTP